MIVLKWFLTGKGFTKERRTCVHFQTPGCHFWTHAYMYINGEGGDYLNSDSKNSIRRKDMCDAISAFLL